mmetsp:Transcript_4361/g.5506  ORF Transcript_4361/g.5506 Transcript_4361/m.5506 type:complete len:278 (+) Transcript_4361:154-987(+)
MTMSAPLENKTVQVTGVEGRSEINGKTGKAVAFDAVKGRYHVKLFVSGEVIALKPDNVIPYNTPNQNQGNNHSYNYDNNRNLYPEALDIIGFFKNLEVGFISLFFIAGAIFQWDFANVATAAAIALAALSMSPSLRDSPAFRSFKDIERQTGRAIGYSTSGKVILVSLAAAAVAYQTFGLDSRRYGYHTHFMNGFSLENMSVFTLMMLALMIYRLDIPRNGLAAFSRLHIFEMIWLWNTIQQLFGNGRARHAHRGYGHAPGYGYGGYGRGYGRRGYY